MYAVLGFFQVMESKNLIYLVTEYAANGELLGKWFFLSLFLSLWKLFDWIDLLIREKRLTEAKAKEKFRQLVLAVEYIHSKNIVSDRVIFFFSTIFHRFCSRFIVSRRTEWREKISISSS